MGTSSYPWQSIEAASASMLDQQLLLVMLAFVLAITVGSAIFTDHYRRVGKPALRSLLNPLDLPLLQFNGREWILLAAVTVAFFAPGFAAVLSGSEV